MRVRRETSKESRGNVPYGEDIASHTISESCALSCEGRREALTGARTGQLSSRERFIIRGVDAVRVVWAACFFSGRATLIFLIPAPASALLAYRLHSIRQRQSGQWTTWENHWVRHAIGGLYTINTTRRSRLQTVLSLPIWSADTFVPGSSE